MYLDKPKPPTTFLIFQILFMCVFAAVLLFGLQTSASASPIVVYIFLAIVVLMLLVNLHAALKTGYIIKNGYVVAKAGYLITVYAKVDQITAVSKTNSATRLLGWNFANVQGVANRFNNLLYIQAGKKNFFISPTDVDVFITELEKAAGKKLQGE